MTDDPIANIPENRATSGQFQKGQSGNPGGRPKVEREIRELAQQYGPAALARLVELTKSRNERVAVAACQAILDRAYGKAQQAIALPPESPYPGLIRIAFVNGPDELRNVEASKGDVAPALEHESDHGRSGLISTAVVRNAAARFDEKANDGREHGDR